MTDGGRGPSGLVEEARQAQRQLRSLVKGKNTNATIDRYGKLKGGEHYGIYDTARTLLEKGETAAEKLDEVCDALSASLERERRLRGVLLEARRVLIEVEEEGYPVDAEGSLRSIDLALFLDDEREER